MESFEHGPLTPYRPPPQIPPRLVLRARRTVPLSGRQIALALACVVVTDIAVFSGSELVWGGFGASWLFGALPVLLFVGVRWRRHSTRLALVGAMLAIVAARCVYAPNVCTVVAGGWLVFACAVALRLPATSLGDVVGALGGTFVVLPRRVRALFAGAHKQLARTKLGRANLAAVLIPLALVSVFAVVFALANPVVEHGFALVGSAIERSVSLPGPLRVLFWAGTLFGGLLLTRPGLRLPKAADAGVPAAATAPSLTKIRASRNTLVALNALFFAYNALDAAYLWAGAPPPGMDTQEYARHGVVWLTVAMLMLTCVLGVMFRGGGFEAATPHSESRMPEGSGLERTESRTPEGSGLERTESTRTRWMSLRTLAYAWIAQGGVLALGTYRRISIHVATSGLSNLRIAGILGTTLVCVGLVLVAMKLRRRRSVAWLLRRQLDAFAVTFFLFAVTPTHLLSARVNVARISHGEYRPLIHMHEQGPEAESAPALLPLLDHPDARVRQSIAALLLNERDALRDGAAGVHNWRERDLASERALASLEAATPRLVAALGDANRARARAALDGWWTAPTDAEMEQSVRAILEY
jgi:hypothetical protein